jgi:hypothetical protein
MLVSLEMDKWKRIPLNFRVFCHISRLYIKWVYLQQTNKNLIRI